MLNVCDLSFDYSDKPLLQSINFSVQNGTILHLRGYNGSGKTTLLKLLGGLLHPTQGEIFYNGNGIANDLSAYQRQICYVGHKTGVSLALTVAENCYFDMQWRANLNFAGVLERFNLLGLENTPCGLLSAGQRRRVGLLRLLMTNASLWLLDEPLVALDSESVNLLMCSISDHINNKGTVILTSHQPLPEIRGKYEEYGLD